MPRVDNLGKNVDDWYKAQYNTVGNGSSHWDVCRSCADDLERDPHCYDAELEPYNGDPSGEDGRGDDIDHPDYEEIEFHYRCEVCKAPLTSEDN